MRNITKIFGLALLTGGLGFGAGHAAAEIASQSEAGQVGMVVSKLLEERHFSAHPVDNAMSKEFLKNYINYLDYNHLFFLQSDIDSFQKYAAVLDDDLILGDAKPAFEIYTVYSNRVEQACTIIKQLVQDKYAFDGGDAMVIDRHEAPWAANENEWRDLLRQHVKYELLEERLNKEKPDEAVKMITRRYDRMLRALHENDTDTITDLYLNALASLYDPHTQYMAPVSLDNFTIEMRLSLIGIGAVLSSEDGFAKIASLVPGGPADLDKHLKVNDRIVGVAQEEGPMVDVVDMKLNKVVELIRGKKGTIVHLKVIPANATDSSTREIIDIKRDEIKLAEQEAKAKIIEKPTAANGVLKLGYIDLPSFYGDMEHGPDAKSCARDVRRLLEKLKAEKVDGLIFDLRRNTGGSLQEAITLTGLFVDEGPVVQVKDARGRVSIGRDTDSGTVFDGPMIILTSHISASASEILAAALQDYGRAVIVGDHQTFGKGTVQQMMGLDSLVPFKRHDATGSGALKLTIQKFYRISGGSTQSKGVVPDVELPSVLDVSKIGENQLPHYLPYDEVVPASFTPWSRKAPPVEELKRRSAARTATEEEFRFVLDDIQRIKKKTDEKTVSLNEAKRLAEKKDNEDRNEIRKKEREAHKVEPLKTTEITLAGLDGKTNTTAVLTRQTLDQARSVIDAKPPKVESQLAEHADVTQSVNKVTSKSDTNKVAAAEAATPAPDPYLTEGENILTDYIQLLGATRAQN